PAGTAPQRPDQGTGQHASPHKDREKDRSQPGTQDTELVKKGDPPRKEEDDSTLPIPPVDGSHGSPSDTEEKSNPPSRGTIKPDSDKPEGPVFTFPGQTDPRQSRLERVELA